MRRKTIIDGFKNSQKFRFILRQPGSNTEVGMYITIKQMSEQFATRDARVAVWDAMLQLANSRYLARAHRKEIPIGLVTDAPGGFQVQVDLIEEQS